MPNQVLASKPCIGAVSRCSHGCFHVQFGRTTITLTEGEYVELVALINESAGNFELLRRPQDACFGLGDPEEGRRNHAERNSAWEA